MAEDLSSWTEVSGNSEASEVWNREGVLTGLLVQKQSGVGPNDSMFYTLEREDNTKIGVWGSTVLDTKFETIPIGTLVRIESLGIQPSKTPGRKGYYDYKVMYKSATPETSGGDALGGEII